MKKWTMVLCVAVLVLFASAVEGQAAEVLEVATGEAVPAAEELGTATGEDETDGSGLSSEKVGNGNASRMRYLDRVGASINILDDGTASVTADAYSYASGVTNLLIVAELQQLRNGEWYTLRTYRYFTGDTTAVIMETCTVDRGYYYRVVNTTTAYAGSDSETRVAATGAWNFFVPGT